MKSFSVDRGISPFIPVLGPVVALLLTLGCSGTGGTPSGAGTGGSTSTSSSTVNGGASVPSSTTSSGGNPGSGGITGKGGTNSTSEIVGSGGSHANGGMPGSGGSEKGGTTGTGGTTTKGGNTSIAGTGGAIGTGGTTAKGGTTSTSTTTGSGGVPGKDAGSGADGAPGTGTDAGTTVNCSATMPDGGTTSTGTSVYGTADGLGYGIWTNGSGGSITVFPNAHAFSTSWSESKDFLAHLGLDFRPAKAWATYGAITADFSETKHGTAGGFSMIGMYGWTNSPCVEWYINEDSWNGLGGGGNITANIDGGTYYLKTVQTNGTGGANACESGHTGTWTQMISTRKTARTCGTITVSDHFAAWEKQGWTMGALTSVHINVEVGGGTGSIDFPVANVTTTNK